MRDEDCSGGNTHGYGEDAVQAAREAAARGEWEEAFRLFRKADADGQVGPADLPVLAEVAYAAGHFDVTIETWERAHVRSLEAGDRVGAAGAAVRVAMHLLFDTALMAPVRGWLARAERLLEGEEDTPAHAWHAVVRTYERMLTGDPGSARESARRAVELGSRMDPAAYAIGRVAEARLRILDGEVPEGLALLDEVGASMRSGELDPMSTGVVYCELVCALQGAAQYDVAEEWTKTMERWSHTSAVGSLHGRCRVHRAEILRLRGSCHEAEQEALEACRELRPYLRREMGWPLAELGRIRLRMGDLPGAEEALLDAHGTGWDPQPTLALVRLAQGDVETAVASIREALERPLRVPSKELPPNTELRRAPLLDAQVEIEIAAGNLDVAGEAAGELRGIADRFQSHALAASATLAEGRIRLAEGDAPEATRLLSEAARRWNDVGAPYEAALARFGLADALGAGGSESEAALERSAAQAILAGFEAARGAPQTGDRQRLFRREGDFWSVEFEGRTVRIRDLKGMHYLAQLLAAPGREFHVLDLVAAETGGEPRPALGDAGELLDPQAKDAYRRRLEEIEDDIDQARMLGDAERAEQAQTERDFLARELARAVGLGGRDRRASSASERARAGVTRALRQGIRRIDEHHPELGEHLDRAVRTGTYCAYVPDERAGAGWSL